MKAWAAVSLPFLGAAVIIALGLCVGPAVIACFTYPSLADPEGKVVQALGASTAPRFYIVENGTLVGIWKDTESWPTAWTGGDRK